MCSLKVSKKDNLPLVACVLYFLTMSVIIWFLTPSQNVAFYIT